MKKLKAAIVGCGRISVSYADAFHRLSDEVELIYAVDKDPALACEKLWRISKKDDDKTVIVVQKEHELES